MFINSYWANTIKECLKIAHNIGSSVLLLDPKQIFLNDQEIESYFAPSILIWDPVAVSKKRCPILCPEHFTELLPTDHWLDASDNSRYPRQLVDLTGPMLLIGRIYKCYSHNHHVRTTDASLLRQCYMNVGDIIFTHKSAFKAEFVDAVSEFVVNGMSFPRIVSLIREKTIKIFNIQLEKYERNCILYGIEPDKSKSEEILETWLKMVPKSDSVEDLFKAWFRKNKELFKRDFISLSAKVVTIDHTFKVSYYYNFFFQHHHNSWRKLP